MKIISGQVEKFQGLWWVLTGVLHKMTKIFTILTKNEDFFVCKTCVKLHCPKKYPPRKTANQNLQSKRH